MGRLVIACICGLGGSPALAQAHDLGVECKQKSGTAEIVIEVYYDDDSPAIGAKVEVFDMSNKPVGSGKTDGNGFWHFLAPAPGLYHVKADAGAGHLAHDKITVRDWQTEEIDSPESSIQSGAPREERTRFPWLKFGIGVGTIFLFSLAFRAARILSRARSAAE